MSAFENPSLCRSGKGIQLNYCSRYELMTWLIQKISQFWNRRGYHININLTFFSNCAHRQIPTFGDSTSEMLYDSIVHCHQSSHNFWRYDTNSPWSMDHQGCKDHLRHLECFYICLSLNSTNINKIRRKI